MRIEQRALVEDVIHRLADVDVVKGRNGEIHADRPEKVPRVDFDAAESRIGAHLLDQPRHDLGRRRSTKDDVSLAAIHHVRRIVVRQTHRDLDAIDVRRSQPIACRRPRWIPDEGQRTARPIARYRKLLLRRDREIEPFAPFDHVRAGGHEKTSVPAVVSGGNPEFGVRSSGS